MKLRFGWHELSPLNAETGNTVQQLPLVDHGLNQEQWRTLGCALQQPTGVLHLGMGGSVLGLRALNDVLADRRCSLYSCDSPAELDRLLESARFDTVVAGSKSGNTVEVLAMLSRLEGYCHQDMVWYGLSNDGNAPIARTIEALGGKVGLATNGTGGRFSVFQPVNQLSLQLCGSPAKPQSVSGWQQIAARARQKNADYAALWVYQPGWDALVDWWNQLVAESMGQKGAGVLPLAARAPHAQHSVAQLLLEGRFTGMVWLVVPAAVGEHEENASSLNLVRDMAKASALALQDAGVDVVWLEVSSSDDLATLLLFAMRFVAAWGLGSGIDPFVQPGVEAIKIHLKSAAAEREALFAKHFTQDL